MEAPIKSAKVLGFKWLFAFIVPIILWFVPMSADVTPKIRKFLVVTVWAILMFMFELLDTAIVSLSMILMAIAYGLCRALKLEPGKASAGII